MRKIFVFILSCACLICFLAGCTVQSHPSTPNALSPAILVDDALYYSTGKAITVEIEKSDFLGRITSPCLISQLPTQDGQANIPFEGAPYATYEDGIVVLMDEEWTLFESRD